MFRKLALGIVAGGLLCAGVVGLATIPVGPTPRGLPSDAELWGHMGYAADAPPNSLRAVEAAIAAGARGVEVDAFYDAKTDRFVISRTRAPYQRPDGKRLVLEQIIERHRDQTQYWIDLKNLSLGNAAAVLARLDALLDEYSIRDRTYLESTSGLALRRLVQAGVRTIYTIDLMPRSLWYLPRVIAAASMVALTEYAVIGVPHQSMDGLFMRVFGHRPLFVFTVNNPALLERLERLETVRVVLSDSLFAHAPGRSVGDSSRRGASARRPR